MEHKAITIGGVKVCRKHVKSFCGYAGIVLMALDAATAMTGVAHAAPMAEPVAAEAGKLGAVLSGLVFWFERMGL